MRTLHCTGIEVEDRTDSTNKLDIQPVFILVYPLFLLGRHHPHPEDIGCGPVDRLNHRPVLLLAKDFLERRRICSRKPDAGKFPNQPGFNGRQRLLRRTQKKIGSASPIVQPAAQLPEDVAPRDPLPNAAAQYP